MNLDEQVREEIIRMIAIEMAYHRLCGNYARKAQGGMIMRNEECQQLFVIANKQEYINVFLDEATKLFEEVEEVIDHGVRKDPRLVAKMPLNAISFLEP